MGVLWVWDTNGTCVLVYVAICIWLQNRWPCPTQQFT